MIAVNVFIIPAAYPGEAAALQAYAEQLGVGLVPLGVVIGSVVPGITRLSGPAGRVFCWLG